MYLARQHRLYFVIYAFNITYKQDKDPYKHTKLIVISIFCIQQYLQRVTLKEIGVHCSQPVEVKEFWEVYHNVGV